MKRLLIFDLDGTILNTLDDLAESTNYALRENQLPERSLDEVRAFVGNGIGKLIERAVPEGSTEGLRRAVLESFTAHYREHSADKTRPYDNIMELLETLKEEGYLLAVVSNKADFAVQSLCEQYFPGVFTFAVGEREGVRRKPCPDSVNEVLETLKVQREEAVYIGDSEVDVQTARAAEMDLIAVAWGFRDCEVLKAQGANIIVEAPEEILKVVHGQL